MKFSTSRHSGIHYVSNLQLGNLCYITIMLRYTFHSSSRRYFRGNTWGTGSCCHIHECTLRSGRGHSCHDVESVRSFGLQHNVNVNINMKMCNVTQALYNIPFCLPVNYKMSTIKLKLLILTYKDWGTGRCCHIYIWDSRSAWWLSLCCHSYCTWLIFSFLHNYHSRNFCRWGFGINL